MQQMMPMPVPAEQPGVGDVPVVRRREVSLATLLPDTRGADDEATCDGPPIVAATTTSSSTAADAEPATARSALDDSDEAAALAELASLFLPKPPLAFPSGPASPPGKRRSRPPSLPVAITPASALSPIRGRGPFHDEPPAAVISKKGMGEEDGGPRGRGKAHTAKGEQPQQQKRPASTAPCLGESSVRTRSTSGQARPRSSMEEVGRWLESFDGRFKHSLKTFEQCLG